MICDEIAKKKIPGEECEPIGSHSLSSHISSELKALGIAESLD